MFCLQKKIGTGLTVLFLLAGLSLIACSQPDDPISSTPVDAATPSITTQPQNGSWDVGKDGSFPLSVTATVTGGGTLSYQWYSNTSNSNTGGSILSGKTDRSLVLNKPDYNKNGNHYFYVVVTNTNNSATGKKTASVTSNVATVNINGVGDVYLENAEEPEITTEPAPTTGWNVASTNSIDLTVVATSSDGGTLSYQWYSNTVNSNTGGSEMAGKKAETLTLNKTDYTVNSTFYFYVVVTNTIEDNDDGGIKTASTTSDVATVTVTGNGPESPPVFTIPADLKGEWDPKASGEELSIDDTWFSYSIDSNGTESGHGGIIVNHRADGAGAGYITVEYGWHTDYEEATGHFYVIHYKNLTSKTVSISAAHKADAPEFDTSDPDAAGGKATRQEAEAAYTVAGGYFTGYSHFTKGTHLKDGVWTDGELTAGISTVTYTFNVTGGTTYYVWWNDRYEGATPRNKTADIEVWATYSDGTDIFEEDIFEPGYIDSGWITPQFFTADTDDIVSVVVQASHTASQEAYKTGTFGIAYSTASIRPGAAVAKTITLNQWEDTTIATDEIHVYTINVTQNQTYYIWWNEKETEPAGDGTKTANVQVQARYGDEDLIFVFSAINSYANQWADNAWTAPRIFTADRNGTVDVRVRPSWGEERSRGTYGIVYNTSGTRPIKTATLNSVTQNGSSGTPTTELTLTFNQAVSGLSAADITLALVGAPFSVTKGDFSGEGSSYTMEVSSPIDGTLTVTVGSSSLFNITGSPKEVTVYGDGSNSVTTLVENLWVYDEFTDKDDVHWYKFDVTAGTTYRIWWDDEKKGFSTADTQNRVYVNGAWVYGTATEWKDEDGWNGFYSYPASGTGTVYVCIRPYNHYAQWIGTYGVVFSTGATRPPVRNPNDIPVTLSSVTASGSPTTALTLTFDQVIAGLVANDIILTLDGPPFGVTKGTLSGDGPVYTLPITNSPVNGTLTVTVEKPGYYVTPSKEVTVYGSGGAIPVTPLEENKWVDGNLPEGSSEDWYSFTVTAGTTYRIWWSDRDNTGGKTADVGVDAFYADGTTIFPQTDVAWNTPEVINVTENGKVFVKVRPYNNSNGFKGTYGIVFSTGSSRPAL